MRSIIPLFLVAAAGASAQSFNGDGAGDLVTVPAPSSSSEPAPLELTMEEKQLIKKRKRRAQAIRESRELPLPRVARSSSETDTSSTRSTTSSWESWSSWAGNLKFKDLGLRKRDEDPLDNRGDLPEVGYYNPKDKGGGMLTIIPVTYPMGQGEPANIIISGNSDVDVLRHQEVDGGLLNYFESLGYSGECLGQTGGSRQGMDLGDGHGNKNQTAVMRWNYGDPQLGTCTQTVIGGNHFRYWIQDGPEANSGAVFLAASVELPIAQGHDIVRNGYNIGRDEIVGNITEEVIPTLNLTADHAYTGRTSANGYTYFTDIKFVTGLLENTNDGINHNTTVQIEGVVNSTDGYVAVFEVRIEERPEGSGVSLASSKWVVAGSLLALALPFML